MESPPFAPLIKDRSVRAFNIATLALVIAGAILLGLAGQFQFDLIARICGGTDTLAARALYASIGLSGLWQLVWLATHKPVAQLV